jgi:hypothetical protein
MGCLLSCSEDPIAELEALKAKRELLKDEKKGSRGVGWFVVGFFFFLSWSLFVAWDYKFNAWVWSLMLVSALTWVAMRIDRWWRRRTNGNFKEQKKKLEKKILDSIDEQTGFIDEFDELDRRRKAEAARPVASLPGRAWDWVTGSHRHNRRALICGRCGMNNGLHKAPPVFYYCPHCGEGNPPE